MADDCPAGGPHRYVEESPADYYLATGIRRSDRSWRIHCDECGAAPPPSSTDGG